MTVLFSENFEGGIGAYSQVLDAGNTIDTDGTHVHGGTKALHWINLAANNNAQIFLTGLALANTHIFMGGWLYITTLGRGRHIALYDAASTHILVSSYIATGTASWGMDYEDDAGTHSVEGGAFNIQTNQWYFAQVEWLRNNGAGLVRQWINGLMYQEVTGLSNASVGTPDVIYMGFTSGIANAQEGWFDDAFITDEYISYYPMVATIVGMATFG